MLFRSNLVNVNAQYRVKFAVHQLTGVAGDWWENYCEAHDDAEGIDWNDSRKLTTLHTFVMVSWS